MDAEAVCGLDTLTTLSFDAFQLPVEEAGEWMLDLSRLTTLTIHLKLCAAVKDREVLALSNLTGLADLNLEYCNVTSEGVQTLSSLTAHEPLPFLLQSVGRGEAGAAHRHPQPPDHSWLRTLQPPCSCCHAAPQRTPRGVQRLTGRAT